MAKAFVVMRAVRGAQGIQWLMGALQEPKFWKMLKAKAADGRFFSQLAGGLLQALPCK